MTEVHENNLENLKDNDDEKVTRLSEWKLAKYCLIFSICVMIAKVYSINSSRIRNFFLQDELIKNEYFRDDGELMFRYMWGTSLKYSSIWFPILCGICGTYFTWIIVYLDSNVPGINPPSPLSPAKYKIKSGHSLHLNYAFSLLVGVLVSITLYTHEVNLKY